MERVEITEELRKNPYNIVSLIDKFMNLHPATQGKKIYMPSMYVPTKVVSKALRNNVLSYIAYPSQYFQENNITKAYTHFMMLEVVLPTTRSKYDFLSFSINLSDRFPQGDRDYTAQVYTTKSRDVDLVYRMYKMQSDVKNRTMHKKKHLPGDQIFLRHWDPAGIQEHINGHVKEVLGDFLIGSPDWGWRRGYKTGLWRYRVIRSKSGALGVQCKEMMRSIAGRFVVKCKDLWDVSKNVSFKRIVLSNFYEILTRARAPANAYSHQVVHTFKQLTEENIKQLKSAAVMTKL